MTRFRAKTYVIVLICAMLVVYAYHLRTAGIFACEGTGYTPDRFMAYCNSVSYLNYDQGAFWFQTEERAYDNAKDADVMFIGNSKLQFAMSTDATKSWFEGLSEKFFLFGFAQYETVEYFSPVLKSMQPRARVYIIHVDRLFEDRVTPPMQMIRQDGNAETLIRRRKLWQPVHRAICSTLPAICGHEFGLYRDRSDGSWVLSGGHRARYATDVHDVAPTNTELWPEYVVSAKQFIAQLPADEECIFLTLVPSETTRRAEAQSIAETLNMPLVSPDLLNLRTFDAEHLDPPSAERWSSAFLDIVGPGIRACLAAG